MILRALIVDDEPLARDVLQFFLEDHADIEVVGECANGREAVAHLRSHEVDLVLLDVQMPGWDGFEVARQIGPAAMPAVIFVTAFDAHAVQAFDLNAVDYLLKPVAEQRLRKALDRLRQRLGGERIRVEAERLSHLLTSLKGSPSPVDSEKAVWSDRLQVQTGGRRTILEVRNLSWIEGAGDYVYLHAGRRKHLLRDSLVNLETRLDPKTFCRIHRSAIVNLQHVAEVRSAGHGDFRLLLKDGTLVKGSRTYNQRFKGSLAADGGEF